MYLFGDLHGSHISFENRISKVPPGESVVCLGDVGLRYGGRTSYGLRDHMVKAKDHVFYVMRGNHDDRYISNRVINQKREQRDEIGAMYDGKYPNIRYISDSGGMFEIEGKKCLFIPGAYSVDKWYRLMNVLPYNPDEQLFEDEMSNLEQIAEDAENIDIVFSHMCPISWQYEFKDLFLRGVDQSSVDNTMEVWLQEKILPVVEKKNPDYKWYFGHYHDNRVVANGHGVMLMDNVIGV